MSDGHDTIDDTIDDTPVDQELRDSFLEYAMSVVTARAIPDVRDGLKPVQRRILYGMFEERYFNDRKHVKSAKIVGHVMGQYHPHGDAAIYDALVRMVRDFAMRIPLVDGHGNFGTHTDPPAAMRYSEARMSLAAEAMTADLEEDTVDWQPNYDGQDTEPKVLPAAFPNLLVNGTTGIAVGMATNMPPHHLGETVAACRHLLAHPDATVDELMAFMPGPDLPTGGIIAGLDGVKEAYRTGRGAFKMRAATKITDVSARQRGIVITELPYTVGPEAVIQAVKDAKAANRLAGVSNIVDYSGRKHGMQIVVTVKTGFNPAAVLDELFRVTPLEKSFTVHNLALVDGQPRTLTLRELLGHFVNHRLEVTRRRCEYRRREAQRKAHLLEGYLIALASIEEVVAVIRGSKDTAAARTKLMKSFALSEVQAASILEMPLRRLTSLEVNKIKSDLKELQAQITELTRLLESDTAMRELISGELAATAGRFDTPRRTKLLDGVPAPASAAELEIPDEPCVVTLSTSGVLGRFDTSPFRGTAGKHDALVSRVQTSARSTVALLTSTGQVHRLPVVEVPVASGRNRGAALTEFVELDTGETPVALLPLAGPRGEATICLVTAGGVVKRLPADGLPAKSGLPVIGLKDGDALVAAFWLADDDHLIMVSSDAQALRTAADGIRPQKAATAAGMAGMRLSDGARVLTAAPANGATAVVVTVTDGGAAKSTGQTEYPAKGRGTAGVRTMRFLRGETRLVAAWVGDGTAGECVGVAESGELVKLPDAPLAPRDAAGVKADPAPVLLAAAR